MTHAAMQSLHHLWRSHIATLIQLRVYNSYILAVLLYSSDCWTVNKADIWQIDALDLLISGVSEGF